MAKIEIESHFCTVSLSKLSSCENCISVCPTNAISKLNNGLVSIAEINCVECGVCSAVCPTEAIKLSKFSSLDSVFKFLEHGENILDCKKNVPCLASISIEYLLSFAILKKENILANYGHCSECSIFNNIASTISMIIDEVNFILQAFNLNNRIVLINEPENKKIENNFDKYRRILDINLFERIGGEIRDVNYKLMRQKRIPPHRRLLLMALKKIEPSEHVLSSNDLNTISQKYIDPNLCTGCQLCWRICPTDALSSNNHGSFINFDSAICLKCRLCHDVCEPDAIKINDSFFIKKLFENKIDRLIDFKLSRCAECNILFVSRDNKNLCHRCEIEEKEAHDLWGLNF